MTDNDGRRAARERLDATIIAALDDAGPPPLPEDFSRRVSAAAMTTVPQPRGSRTLVRPGLAAGVLLVLFVAAALSLRPAALAVLTPLATTFGPALSNPLLSMPLVIVLAVVSALSVVWSEGGDG